MNACLKKLFGTDASLSDRIYTGVAFVFMLTAIASCFYYIFTDAYTNSDYVENVIWAQESLDSGRLLNPEFYYGYAMPLGGNVFMLPFVAAFGMTLTANRLGMALFFIFLLFALFSFASAVSKTKAQLYSIVNIILLSMFTACGHNLLHHIIYYGLAFCVTMGMLGCCAALLNDVQQHRIKWYVLLAVWSFIGASNGIVSVVLGVLPAVLGIAVFLFFKDSAIFSRANLREYRILGVTVAAAILGLVFYYVAMRDIPDTGYSQEFGAYTMSGTEVWIQKLGTFAQRWFALFDIPEEMSVQFFSKTGIYMLAKTFIAIVIFVAPIIMLFLWNRLDKNTRIIMITHITTSLICICEYTFGSKIYPEDLERLLYCMLLTSFIVTGVFLTQYVKQIRWRAVTLIAVAGFTAMSAFAVWRSDKTPMNKELIETLKAENFRYGFASFWNANVNTVLSEGEVKVREVSIKPSYGVTDRLFQANKNWYVYQENYDEIFLLLTPEEYEIISDANKFYVIAAKRSFEVSGYTVLVYDSELWYSVNTVRPIQRIYTPDTSLLTIKKGTVNENETSVTLSENGYATVMSPYLQPGNYVVEIKGNGLKKAIMKATYNEGGNSIELFDIEAQDHKLTCKFITDGANAAEFTVRNGSADDIEWNSLTISWSGP